MIKTTVKLFLLLSMIIGLGACSDAEVDDIELDFSPSRPKVKTTNGKIYVYTADTGEDIFEDVKAPWFKVGLILRNGTSKSIVVDKITLKVTGASSSGTGFLSADYLLDSSMLAVNKDDDQGNNQDVLFAFSTGGNNEEEPLVFYIGGLPADVTTGVYTVEVTMNGWFGTILQPGDAFMQKYYFVTN